ncbi:MAG: hypothetical protein KC731_27345, partial [Myxococcales bacterium]|nr:hypothetical protein [Myxococcales bacterium]
QFRFAPRDKLQTYVDTARPLARHDKRLAAILESAEEVLGTPLAELPSVAESQRLEVAEAWRRANRELEDDFLDESARRLLLRRRAFDRRRVLDSLHLRGSLSDGEHEVVIYVPEPTAKRLPITSELNGVAICRLLGRQDEQEKASTALFALALGQVVTH